MAFQKGQSGNPAGRRKGSKNKLTTAARLAIVEAFAEIGGVPEFAKWARENRTDFYTKVYPRLLPVEVTGPDGEPLPVIGIIEVARPAPHERNGQPPPPVQVVET